MKSGTPIADYYQFKALTKDITRPNQGGNKMASVAIQYQTTRSVKKQKAEK